MNKMIEKGIISVWYNEEKKLLEFSSEVDLDNLFVNFYINKKLVSNVNINSGNGVKENHIHWILPYKGFSSEQSYIVCEFLYNKKVIHKEKVEIKSRISMCISGVPRFYKENIETFNYIKSKFDDIDVFIHIWKGIDDLDIDNFIDLYKPKSILIEDYADIKPLFEHMIRIYKIDNERLFSMFYSVYKANKIKKLYSEINDVKYKYDIRYRTDIKFKILDFDGILEKLNDNDIIVPMTNPSRDMMSDCFAIGKSSKMDIYSSVFSEFKMLFETSDEHAGIPEYFLTKQLSNYNIKYHKYKCDFGFVRS